MQLAEFIKEIGMPTTFAELGISEDTDLRAVANSTVVTPGCCKKLTSDEIYEILVECKIKEKNNEQKSIDFVGKPKKRREFRYIMR